jgi:hypothetical protein
MRCESRVAIGALSGAFGIGGVERGQGLLRPKRSDFARDEQQSDSLTASKRKPLPKPIQVA